MAISDAMLPQHFRAKMKMNEFRITDHASPVAFP